MFKASASLFLGIMFVIIGAVNVWLILQASARVKNARASARLIAAHRIGGYIFISLFCVMSYFMIARMRDSSGTASAGTMIHLTVAMLLSPLLFVKVLIARYYKSYYGFLMPIGLLIFVLSFVLVAIAAGPYLIRNTNIRSVSLEEINLPSATIDLTQAASTMEQRCSKCHNLERVVAARKDARGWLTTVNRMRKLPASRISEQDVKTIVSFLVSQNPPEESGQRTRFVVAKALVNQRCSACHTLDRVYQAAKTPAEWRDTVALMVNNAQTDGNAGLFLPGEDQQIVEFLSMTQTPDAVNRRKTQASMASSAGLSLVKSPGVPVQPVAESHRINVMSAFGVFAGCLGVAVLMVRRPDRIPISLSEAGSSKTSREAGTIKPVSASRHSAVILQLVRITQQTPDTKTLRFTLAENHQLATKPGQFLTFTFLFDGKKVIRSYSICSSPGATRYIEITPKRVEKGCASVFLNDRAAIGMTVEAIGPFGQFYFDEARHKRVVLIAGGSGITPIMAILRYIDDFCLPTTATLLYSVRTHDDIIFRTDLEELRSRLDNFQYHILLSQPRAEWSGPKGRLNREFVECAIKEPSTNHFFICGPGPFMETARQILAELGVAPERIIWESFGSGVTPGSPHEAESAQTTSTIEFVRSAKTHSARHGQTLLQAAEQCGVNIPFGCRQGQCGTCKVKLLEGAVSMEAEQGLPHNLKEQGYVLTCVGHAKGLVKLDV